VRKVQKIEWLLQAIMLPGMSTLLVAFLCALAAKYLERLKDERLRELLVMLVKAAEQIYGPGRGDLKRDYVSQQARAQGLGDVAGANLEAAVYEMKAGR